MFKLKKLPYELQQLNINKDTLEDIFYFAKDAHINDERYKNWKKQKKKYGFDEREICSLDYTIAVFLYTRLKFYLDNICVNTGITSRYGKNRDNFIFQHKLKLAIRSFKMQILTENNKWNEMKEKKFKLGLKAFIDIYSELWF